MHFTVLDQVNASLQGVEIRLGSSILLITGNDGKNMTDFLPVHEFCPVNISKLGYEVTDAPANITVNEYTQNNKYTLRMAIKKVNKK